MPKVVLAGASADKKATRVALGETLLELLEEGAPVVAVDADLSSSTTTKKLAETGRLFNCGIAEQNMIGVAAGLSLTGHIPFTGSFAVFGTGRVYDQIRNTVAYSNLDVKITPTHAGISVGPDGGSHQMLEDISLMRGLPSMQVLVPADYASAKAAIRLAAQTPGPVYIRLGRANVPSIYQDSSEFEIGKSYIVKEGTDATVVACGVEVNEALRAADVLAKEGISIEIIDAFSVKPFDNDMLIRSAKKTGCVVVAEEHSLHGGLCSTVSEVLAENYPVPCSFVAMRDTFGKSGEFEELMTYFGLDFSAIVKAVKKATAKKAI